MTLAVIVIFFVGLLLLGMPILVAMGVPALFYVIVKGFPPSFMTYSMIQSIDSFPYVAVPLFILLGKLFTEFGGTERLFDFSRALLRDVKGYSAHVTNVANLIMSGISGSALAELGGLAELEIKAMEDEGYSRSFAAALAASAAINGPIFPPSIPLVIYAMLAEVSSVKSLIAGTVPGIVITIFLAIYIVCVTPRKLKVKSSIGKAKTSEVKYAKKGFWRTTWDALPTLLAVPIILVGMIVGVFSPTEAAAAGVFYAIIVGLIHREFSFIRVLRALKETFITVSSVLIIVAVGSFLTRVMTLERVPELVSSLLLGVFQNRIVILLVINIILLILGMFMEGTCILVLMVPILLPVTKAIGVDPIHLGIIMVYNVMIGLLTPPFGVGLYMVSGIAKLPPEEVLKELLPMFLPLVGTLMLLTYIPQFSLCLLPLLFQN